MDVETWRSYAAENDVKAKSRLRDKLLRDNYKLILTLVGKVAKNLPGELADLQQAGAIGFLVALDKWVPKKGAFSTYAAHWIRYECQKASAHQDTIYMPRSAKMPWPLQQKQDRTRLLEGREPDAADLGVTPEKLDAWKLSPKAFPMEAQHTGGHDDFSLFGPMQFPDPAPLAAIVIKDTEDIEQLHEGLDDLSPEAREIVDLLFYGDMTITEVANVKGWTIERVRLTRDDALVKMREYIDYA